MIKTAQLTKSAIGLSSVMLLSVPLLLLSNILFARNMSTEDFGTYSFILSVAAVFSIPITCGLPLLLTREVARYSQRNEWENYRGLLRSAWRWIFVVSALLFLLFLPLGDVAGRLGLGVLNRDILISSIAMAPLMSLIAIQCGVIRGLGFPIVAALPAQIIQPTIIAVGVLILAAFGKLRADQATIWHITVLAIVFFVTLLALRRIQPQYLERFNPNYALRREWFRSTLAFGAMSAVIVLSTNLAILLLGLAGEGEAVAQMRVAERGAQLIAFPILTFDAIIAPKVVQAIEAGRYLSDLKKLSRASARVSTLGAAVIFTILLFFGKQLISLSFGPEYSEAAYAPMMILVFAQLFYVLTGSPALLLAMAGHEKQAVLGNLLGVIVIFLAASVLISDHGAVGAAISVALGMIVSKSYLLVMANRKIGFWAGVL